MPGNLPFLVLLNRIVAAIGAVLCFVLLLVRVFRDGETWPAGLKFAFVLLTAVIPIAMPVVTTTGTLQLCHPERRFGRVMASACHRFLEAANLLCSAIRRRSRTKQRVRGCHQTVGNRRNGGNRDFVLG